MQAGKGVNNPHRTPEKAAVHGTMCMWQVGPRLAVIIDHTGGRRQVSRVKSVISKQSSVASKGNHSIPSGVAHFRMHFVAVVSRLHGTGNLDSSCISAAALVGFCIEMIA
eukprot:scaffold519693_cov19-Prasinocladus_malaysianus.AAC.2